jgi:hypothetical protein
MLESRFSIFTIGTKLAAGWNINMAPSAVIFQYNSQTSTLKGLIDDTLQIQDSGVNRKTKLIQGKLFLSSLIALLRHGQTTEYYPASAGQGGIYEKEMFFGGHPGSITGLSIAIMYGLRLAGPGSRNQGQCRTTAGRFLGQRNR